MPTDCLSAYNKTFCYTLPCEVVNEIKGRYSYMTEEQCKKELAQKIKTEKKAAVRANLIKFASYIPIVAQIVYGILLNRMCKEGFFSKDRYDEDVQEARMTFSRVMISLSPFGLLLLIWDIFSTLIFKPAYLLDRSLRENEFKF